MQVSYFETGRYYVPTHTQPERVVPTTITQSQPSR